ncbi:coiled-coil domain-containing protein 38-like [Acanthochromis polyacanthus]|uniref:coiled-coil domain-containing protein 38-like n=1 Tax=Acanthochromis polyacanthus TaxID=80966 RepID=UPI002234D66A|nr:coiled-coil domain-containing protein 38-like [Acanthochromis polyacanthus]
MLDAVDKKVTEVLSCFVDCRMPYLNITKKLCNVEYRMSLMLQQIESIPEDRFKILKHIQETQWRNRLREEKLLLEIAKRQEKLVKYMRRSMAEAKKITGRKLMPRCFPVKQNIQVLEEAPVSPVEDLNSYLFSEDSD